MKLRDHELTTSTSDFTTANIKRKVTTKRQCLTGRKLTHEMLLA